MNITQPALTKCIMRMEDDTGTKLFQRKGRLIVPTPVGNVLIRRAKHIIQSIDETQREFMTTSMVLAAMPGSALSQLSPSS